MDKKFYYITTPIYYVNGTPHIGHAYTTVACDVLARYKRLEGYQVKFLTGTDEHGQKVEKAALTKNTDPQSFVDEVSKSFNHMNKTLNISNDDFIRTTQERHKKSAQALWQKLVDNDQIYLGSYSGWYAVRDEAYYAESELTKQEDGSYLAPTGAPVEWVEEPSYFFKLSQWQEALLKLYEDNPQFITPKSRMNEIKSFVKGGLKDLSISRASFSWGVPIPNDKDHVMYVWLDALTNYITALDFPDREGELYNNFWPADVHMVGKDIIRFHSVYWPAFLMAAGLDVPKRISAHGFWMVDNEKMSKSIGNVVDPNELVDHYGLDTLRYFFLRDVPFGQDGDFSHHSIVARMNSDLANDLGNLIQRVLSFVQKHCDGKVPNHTNFTDQDNNLLKSAYSLKESISPFMETHEFHKALEAIWSVSGAANKYIDEKAPWVLRKSDPEQMQHVLYVLMEVIRNIGIILQPFMPESSSKILDLLKIDPNQRGFEHINKDHCLKVGHNFDKPTPIFPRYVEKENAA